MSDWQIWRHKQGLVMHERSGEYPREVRYAVPAEYEVYIGESASETGIVRREVYSSQVERVEEVPIRCVRNVQSDRQDLPRPQWAHGGTFPADKFLELYEPEADAAPDSQSRLAVIR